MDDVGGQPSLILTSGTGVAEGTSVATRGSTIRFNILLVDGTTCVVQPYLPGARGVDSPTFVMTNDAIETGLFPVFAQVFTSLWERSKPV